MRNIEYDRGRVAKVRGGQTAMRDIEGHQVTSFQGRNGHLSYKLKLIAKRSISYTSEFDSPGSSTPLDLGPPNIYIYIYIYIYIATNKFALVASLPLLTYKGFDTNCFRQKLSFEFRGVGIRWLWSEVLDV